MYIVQSSNSMGEELVTSLLKDQTSYKKGVVVIS